MPSQKIPAKANLCVVLICRPFITGMGKHNVTMSRAISIAEKAVKYAP